MNKYYIIIPVFIILTCLPGLSVADLKDLKNELSITIPDNGLLFSEIKEDIEKQTGFRILSDHHLENVSIHGEYLEVEIEELLSRIFKHENISIITDTDNRIIILETLGIKNTSQPHSDSISDVPASSSNRASTEIDSVTGMEKEQLYDMLEQQIERGKEKYEYRGIDPVTGLKKENIDHQIKAQIAAGKAKYQDQGIDPVTGLSTKELENRIKAQIEAGKAKYEAQGINPVTGLPLKGNTLSIQ